MDDNPVVDSVVSESIENIQPKRHLWQRLFSSRSRIFGAIAIIVILVAIPLTVIISQQQQQTKQEASSSLVKVDTRNGVRRVNYDADFANCKNRYYSQPTCTAPYSVATQTTGIDARWTCCKSKTAEAAAVKASYIGTSGCSNLLGECKTGYVDGIKTCSATAYTGSRCANNSYCCKLATGTIIGASKCTNLVKGTCKTGNSTAAACGSGDWTAYYKCSSGVWCCKGGTGGGTVVVVIDQGTTTTCVGSGSRCGGVYPCCTGYTCVFTTAGIGTCTSSSTAPASSATTTCGKHAGACQDINQWNCSTGFVTGHCENLPANIKCCYGGVSKKTTAPAVPAAPGGKDTPTAPLVSPNPSNMNLVFDLGIDAIGAAGDHQLPCTSLSSCGSNKSPKTTSRTVVVSVLDQSSVNKTPNKTATITYDANSGTFKGLVGADLITGSYTVKVKVPGLLTKTLVSIQSLIFGQNIIPSASLTTGDIDNDNKLTVIDYNILISCSVYSYDNKTLCNQSTTYKTLSDLTDDGTVDQIDYNLFLREFAVQSGD